MSDEDPKPINVTVDARPLKDIWSMSRFLNELRFENRFVVSKSTKKFTDDLIEYAKENIKREISKNCFYYRARKHKEPNEPNTPTKHYPLTNMGAPRNRDLLQGRLNPDGIPYLYLANDIQTAVSEVNPWIGCVIDIAKFALTKQIKVIDLTHQNPNEHLTFQDGADEYSFIWHEFIPLLFAMPFDPNFSTAYVPCQFIAENIKHEGFDAILYDSARNVGGQNLTLFDVDIAKPIELYSTEVTSLDCEFLDPKKLSD